MRIYLAGPWVHRHDMPLIAQKIEAAGHTITHPWWLFEGDDNNLTHKFLADCALRDVNGVLSADVVIVVNSAKSEGKATEQGIAIAEEKPIIVIGKLGEHSNNIFHHLNLYHFVTTPEEAISKLEELSFDYGRPI